MRTMRPDGLRITASTRGYRVENSEGTHLGWVQAQGLTWRAIDPSGAEVITGLRNRTDAALHLTTTYRLSARTFDAR